MPSSFHLSNSQGEECVITHPENAGPILIDSNNIALKDQLYNSMVQLKAIATGTATAYNATNRITMTGIGSGDVGDVILMSGWTNNNGEYTIEVIENANNIIVNQAHAGKSRTVAPIGLKALINETATVTVKLLAKWYNASLWLGRGWVDVTSSRVAGTIYQDNTKRGILAKVYTSGGGTGASLNTYINTGSDILIGTQTISGASFVFTDDVFVTSGCSYKFTVVGCSISKWSELR